MTDRREYNKEWNKKNALHVREYKRQYRKKNAAKIKLYNQQYCERRGEWKHNYNKTYHALYYQENKEEVKKAVKEYAYYNKEKILKRQARWRKENREQLSKWYRNYRSIPQIRLSLNIGNSLRKSLKERKQGRHWEKLVGYSFQQLKKHLERKFTKNMSWDDYGKWHIDHIIPKSFFVYSSPDDVEFKMCWRLENLQPLWAKDNFKKSNKLFRKAECIK